MRSDRQLILELFFGRLKSRHRIYPTDERAARKALARLLREGKLDRDLAETLAALIDPDVNLKTQPLRILKFQFRSKARQSDFLRDMMLVFDIYNLIYHEQYKLEDAIAAVAENCKLSPERLTRIWQAFWRRFPGGSPLRGRLKKNKRSVHPIVRG